MSLLLCIALALPQGKDHAPIVPQGRDQIPPAPRELRAAWIATVDNIDWPSKKGLPVAQQQQEMNAILDCAARLKLNTLILQVRPECDALYDSKLEPWSEYLCGAQGKAPVPLWDPLAFATQGAHARGIELHAWFNPYRARAGAAESKIAKSHISQTNPSSVHPYGKNLWCDPGSKEVQDHSLRVILDVVRRYDIDGVHLDDYFYPYPEKQQDFPDGATFRRYRARGGKLSLADWRRDNVDRFVETMSRQVHAEKPWVKVGISPFGIARPGIPAGTTAGIDQYEHLYADVRKWFSAGWCDYLAPQLYWQVGSKGQSYPLLLSWWTTQNPKQRTLVVGNYTSQLARNWPLDELLEQIRITRATPGASGNIHFSMKALLRNFAKIADALSAGPYAQPALMPASPWLDAVPPARPEISVQKNGPELTASWTPVRDAARYAVYARRSGTWSLVEVLPESARSVTVRGEAVQVSAVDRCGNESR